MQPSSLLLFDLETILDAELAPYVPSDAKQGDFPPPPYHQIVSAAWMALDADYRVQRVSVDPPYAFGEPDLLLSFLDLYTPTTALVTWNGRRFDNPVLIARCFRHGIPIPHYYAPRGARYRYSTQGHYDVADQLADQGAGRMWRLSDAARLIGWPGKGETTGADVAALVSEGRMQEVRDYNLEDVAQLCACFYRAELVRGGIELAEYRSLAAELLAFCDQHETLHRLSARVQRARFCL